MYLQLNLIVYLLLDAAACDTPFSGVPRPLTPMSVWYNLRMENPKPANRADEADTQTKLDQLRRRLIAEGLLSHVPTRKKDIERYRKWEPVEIHGKPLSETIIEERE